ncbi:chymotrypsin-1-like [Ctenocephalides felis]|uniref:chymotrypsin-1-like n=1 Tax=Ctenocephalides felis TaxID=7515 RepID=UPI000E6E25B5|nr:chymotrypsin-1-like [Ctenocephalides felis]
MNFIGKIFCVVLLACFSLLHLTVAFLADRIVGGKPAGKYSAPYQVSFRDENNSHFCGGAILNEKWVISAAHCFQNISAFTIVVGTNKLNEGGYVYEVDQVAEQDFDPKTMEHDLALIKIKDEFKFNDKFLLHPVKAIGLLETEVQDDEIAKVTGWGLKKVNDEDSPNDLQVLKSVTISNLDCEMSWLYFNKIFKTQICTQTLGGTGTCMGDSGGPLVINNKLAGVVSFGFPCAVGLPDVFTGVFSYLEWIKQIINKV